VLQSRLQARRARADTRDWVVKRRERTRKLIELGGLIVKARLDVLVEDDRAAIYGALLGLVHQVDGERRDEVVALWRRKGKRAFEAEGQYSAAAENIDMAARLTAQHLQKTRGCSSSAAMHIRLWQLHPSSRNQ
jgi:hypothetical protein